jgi:hypothetical protein
MTDGYFASIFKDEAELGTEIQLFIETAVLKKPTDVFLIIEFDAFELSATDVFMFQSETELENAIDKTEYKVPYLTIRKSERFFAEFSGEEIELSFDLEDGGLVGSLWRVIPRKRPA